MFMHLTYYRYLTDGRYDLHLRKYEAVEYIVKLAKKDQLLDEEDYGEKALQKISGATFFIKYVNAPIKQGEVPYPYAGLGEHKNCECPNCGFDGDMDFGDYNYGDSVWQELSCPECGIKYNDIYTYAGRETAD